MAKELTFASMLKSGIYQNRSVLYDLQPPSGFLHRTEEKNELVMELAPILMNSAVSGIFVYGTPGTGKSALITEIVKEIKNEAGKNKIGIKTAYINCSESRTETVIIIDLLSQLNPEKDYPRMGWTRSKAIDEFEKVLDNLSTNVLVVLDEVDYALKESGDDILYRLSRINNGIKSRLSTILISNDIKVSDYIKPKTQSTIGRIKIIFSPYTSEQLFDIIKERSKFAFIEGVVGDVVIKKIAEIESQRSGDARKALELLDACAKIALSKKKGKITLDLVGEADELLGRDSVISTLTGLTKHQKILFLAMIKTDEELLNSDMVYKDYIKECENYNVEPLTERRVRSFLVEFDNMGMIRTEVGWLKNLHKKTRKITLNFDNAVRNKIRKVLRDTI